MHAEWQGRPELVNMLPSGTLCLFVLRKKTHVGIRADDEARDSTTKGLVSFSTGYDAPQRQPAFFDLSVLSASRVVYALPAATFALPTDRNLIHPGRYGIDDPVPGALVQLGFFLESRSTRAYDF